MGTRQLVLLCGLPMQPHTSLPLGSCACSNIIRLAPPLIISEQQLDEAVSIIKKVFASL